jgi:ribosome biogenesis GTPase
MSDSPGDPGLVVAAHGRRGVVITASGDRREFVVKGRGLRIVCGDRVHVEERPGSEALVATAIAPRRNMLARWRHHGARDEPVAANLSQLVTILAPAPAPDLFLADRHLCAAEAMGCRGLVAWNKVDIATCPPDVAAEFRRIGYDVLQVSSRTGEGMAALRAALAANTSVLVGQSGVGKSSLANALVPGSRATVGALSTGTATGSHTTTAMLMYAIPGAEGGWLVDTPGVRDFIPAIGTSRVEVGYREIRAAAERCRFADCGHDREPGCAVKDGVESGAISRRRYQSYRSLQDASATGS